MKKLKLVLVTGRAACRLIEEIAEKLERELSVEARVLCLPIPVAAMMTTEYLERELPKHAEALAGADVVMIPGYTKGDASGLSSALGLRVVKGPKHAGDILLAVKALLSGAELSPTQPADELLLEQRAAIEREVLEKARARAAAERHFNIRKAPVSPHYPLVIFELYLLGRGEVLPAHWRGAAESADLVSIGVGEGIDASTVLEFIEALRREVSKPLGLDAADPSLVVELAGAVDFITSFPADNVDWLVKHGGVLRDKPVVLTASQGKCEERVEELLGALEKARKHGFSKLVLDPVLSPPLQGLAESMRAYLELKKASPAPVLMGVGNVTELSDVDSHGLNALLAFIGVEVGIELYLTTEASAKTRGCVRELRRALDMAVVARELKKPPKDTAIELLLLKSKKLYTPELPKAPLTVKAVEKHSWAPDPRGYFKIAVDYVNGEIVVQHYEYGAEAPTVEIRGENPYAILKAIVERGLASRADHFFYLGYELAKAEAALKLGRNYEQDRDLF